MAILDGTPQAILAGTWNIQVQITTGTAAIRVTTGSLAPILIHGGSYSKSDSDNYRLPDCNIEAVITGDAVVELNRVGN